MIITLGVRILQIVFAVVVLALSIVLIRGHGPGNTPALIDYGAFCGGAGLLFALIGIVACFIESFQGIVMSVLDGLATLFTLAGGIAYAATIKVGNCGDTSQYGYLARHFKTFGPSLDKYYPGVGDNGAKQARALINDSIGRCREVQATTAFLWFLFACFAVTIGLSFMGARGRGKGSIV